MHSWVLEILPPGNTKRHFAKKSKEPAYVLCRDPVWWSFHVGSFTQLYITRKKCGWPGREKKQWLNTKVGMCSFLKNICIFLNKMFILERDESFFLDYAMYQALCCYFVKSPQWYHETVSWSPPVYRWRNWVWKSWVNHLRLHIWNLAEPAIILYLSAVFLISYTVRLTHTNQMRTLVSLQLHISY